MIFIELKSGISGNMSYVACFPFSKRWPFKTGATVLEFPQPENALWQDWLHWPSGSGDVVFKCCQSIHLLSQLSTLRLKKECGASSE